jgi:hypothetical protein
LIVAAWSAAIPGDSFKSRAELSSVTAAHKGDILQSFYFAGPHICGQGAPFSPQHTEPSSGTFLDSFISEPMRSMEIKVGLIRDKQGIYEGLLQSKSMNRQLAVCYSSEGKLIVKISVVKDMLKEGEHTTVVLVSPIEEHTETLVPLDHIESIYPIRDFIH